MERPTFPLLRILVPVSTALLWGGINRWLVARPHVIELSIEWIGYLLIVGGMIGLAVADLTNPRSKLRRWWRYRTRLFDVLQVPPAFSYIEGGEQHTILVCLRFVKAVKDSSIILRVKIPGMHQGETSIDLMSNVTKPRGSELRLSIGRVEVKHPQTISIFWGDPASTQQTLLVGAYKCVVTIDLQTAGFFRRGQTFSIYLETFTPDSGSMGRFFLTDERTDLYVSSAALSE